ncbi:antitoxin [Conexibacter sp. S30A1]|uniref:antitoxin n=1 Tax=Conexibacter sp. S30A1 TaxID=2937800 RepID=UPI00200BF174|nr:antitoxin [Conexibacter sp. S30A1]
MGFADKLKELADQAQQAVSENREKIQGAVQNLGEAVNDRTEGKYAETIAKAGQRVNEAVDKISKPDAEGAAGADRADAGTGTGSEPAGASDQPTAEPSSAPPEFE